MAASTVVLEMGARNEQKERRATITSLRLGDSLSYTSSGISSVEGELSSGASGPNETCVDKWDSSSGDPLTFPRPDSRVSIAWKLSSDARLRWPSPDVESLAFLESAMTLEGLLFTFQDWRDSDFAANKIWLSNHQESRFVTGRE